MMRRLHGPRRRVFDHVTNVAQSVDPSQAMPCRAESTNAGGDSVTGGLSSALSLRGCRHMTRQVTDPYA